eukprot:2776649-Pyramimonas_sp.AAC.3
MSGIDALCTVSQFLSVTVSQYAMISGCYSTSGLPSTWWLRMSPGIDPRISKPLLSSHSTTGEFNPRVDYISEDTFDWVLRFLCCVVVLFISELMARLFVKRMAR